MRSFEYVRWIRHSYVVVAEGKMSSYPVIHIKKEDIVDTNGAGDAFVGGTCQTLHLIPLTLAGSGIR